MKIHFSILSKLGLLILGLLFAGETLYSQVSLCSRDTAYHFVVLGSSTAAGTGASPSDSSWVNRYRDYLQSLNPSNQLTNLAVGGFTTYRLMPTGFVPPANRPTPDTNRNITAGLALNPDAIIVNLPSNDVSQGFSVAEQLDNFDTIVNRAQIAGVPIWIATTQPKNYGNQANILKQVEVRDSIWAKYSPRVLDFWTGLADSTNQIDPFYDSGDGTHLNNSGHYLLFTRAVDGAIPDALYVPPSYVDYTPTRIEPVFTPDCGDSAATFSIFILNRGIADTGPVDIQVDVVEQLTGQPTTFTTQLPQGLTSCDQDSFLFIFNTLTGGTYNFTAVVSSSNDLRADNDTLTWSASFLGVPALTAVPDTGCGNSSLALMALTDPSDSIRWFDAPQMGNFLGGGPVLPLSNLPTSTTFWAEAVRGDFFFRNELATTTNNNINFNGTMFDLVADSSLVLDSFGLKVTTAGAQVVEVYTRPGTHLGYETNAGAWSFHASYPVQVSNTTEFARIGVLGLNMAAGDTLGVYLQLQNSSSNLGYQTLSNPLTRSTDELTMLTGSGASHNFGGNYFPRDWNGRVYYHFGNRPDGECLGPRIPVQAYVNSPIVSLGNDTILNTTGSIVLNPGTGFSNYQWSDGSTGSTLQLDGNTLGMGVFPISVVVTDSLGCTASDTVIIVFAPLVNTTPTLDDQFLVWPNPANGCVNVVLPQSTNAIQLIDMQGRLLKTWQGGGNRMVLELEGIPNGLYWLRISGVQSEGMETARILSVHH